MEFRIRFLNQDRLHKEQKRSEEKKKRQNKEKKVQNQLARLAAQTDRQTEEEEEEAEKQQGDDRQGRSYPEFFSIEVSKHRFARIAADRDEIVDGHFL
jgi:hypothetical protein